MNGNRAISFFFVIFQKHDDCHAASENYGKINQKRKSFTKAKGENERCLQASAAQQVHNFLSSSGFFLHRMLREVIMRH